MAEHSILPWFVVGCALFFRGVCSSGSEACGGKRSKQRLSISPRSVIKMPSMVATDRAFRALGRAEPETVIALVRTRGLTAPPDSMLWHAP